LTGYDLPLDEIKRFRQWGSRTPGHPEYHDTPGVETTTGPLGQGVGNAVGLALAERYLATKFNRPGLPVVDHYTYAICSDGDLMEGISHEAASLAGHLKLGKLIMLYDSNNISLVGGTELAFSENVGKRFEAYGWQVLHADGHTMGEVSEMIAQAREATDRPSIIICRTQIGYGSPNKQNTHKAHGEPLGADEVRLSKERLGWPSQEPFFVPDEVYDHMQLAVEVGGARQREWAALFERWRSAYAELAREWDAMFGHKLPEDWNTVLPATPTDPKGVGTRVASGAALTALAEAVPALLGGSADLHTSDYTFLKKYNALKPDDFGGRNIHFGVREHAMGAALNGMALHGGIIPYGGTFLVFSDYLRPAIRLASIMKRQVIYVFTHDSIGVGEDGPTHQPVEQIAALRAIPNLYVVRAGDAAEANMAWRIALEHVDGPTALVFSRQAVPTLDRSVYASAEGALKGGYVLHDPADAKALIIGTGTELSMALEAALLLAKQGIAVRVVSLPCWELFARQDKAYQESVLPPTITARVAVEAARPFGWERFIGLGGTMVGVDRFGASAPFKEVYANLGITAEHVAEAVTALL
jgi:transketolase